MLFLKITQVNFLDYSKNISQKHGYKSYKVFLDTNYFKNDKFLSKNKIIEITVREFEIDEILLSKNKRPELKHSFKVIRKGIKDDCQNIIKKKYI